MNAGSKLAAAVVMLTLAGAASAGGGQSALNGTYRAVITDADLKAHGVVFPGAIRENHGIFTMGMHDGRWTWRQKTTNPINPPGPPAPYTIRGNRVTFVFQVPGAPPGAPPPMTLGWQLAGGQLSFTTLRGGCGTHHCDPIARTILTAHPWKKIG
ncbi:MAG TPA: hypothetical protein VFA66_06935 [Gaiellaceae bacterium]|nr:hypothetical protein [Gaiellaceae bacterium]